MILPLNRKQRRAQHAASREAPPTEGKLLRAGSLHRPGKDTGCANCGESVLEGAFFGAVVSEVYLAEDAALDVKAAAERSAGRPIVFGVCRACVLAAPLPESSG